MPESRIEPPFNSAGPFCDGVWYVNGSRHGCLKRQGHDGACWCCDEYPGGDLSPVLEAIANVE